MSLKALQTSDHFLWTVVATGPRPLVTSCAWVSTQGHLGAGEGPAEASATELVPWPRANHIPGSAWAGCEGSSWGQVKRFRSEKPEVGFLNRNQMNLFRTPQPSGPSVEKPCFPGPADLLGNN